MNTQGPAVLDRAPTNPYRQNPGDIGMARGSGPGFDPRAKGLDGDAIDSLLRSRMIEGMRLGHADGFEEASKRFPEVYDEGYRQGAGEGVAVGRQSVGEPLMGGIGRAQALLMQIAAKAKKDSWTERTANDALAVLREATEAAQAR